MSRSLQRAVASWVVLWVLCVAPLHAQGASDLDTLRRLYQGGNPTAAYQLALRLRPALEGDPDFDLLFGLAAIDSGHLGEGVFALERVLAAFPEDDRARLELARGYFLLDEYARARAEFVAVLDRNPPEQVKASIERYLDTMRMRERPFRTSATAYAEAGFGYDSNVNSATDDDRFTAAGLPGFEATLDPSSVSQGDYVWEVAAGGQVVHPVRPGRSLYAAADLIDRRNLGESEFDTGSITGRAGMDLLRGNHRFRLGAQAQHFYLDDSGYRNLYGVNGRWRHNLDARREAIGFATLNRLRYPDQSLRNSHLLNLGVGWRQRFERRYAPELLGTFYGGHEEPSSNDEAARAVAERDILGARLGVQLTLNPKLGFSGSAAWQRSRYQGESVLFEKRRRDNFYGLEGRLTYLLRRHWSLRGEILYYENDSNIVINDYNRTVAMLKLRYDYY